MFLSILFIFSVQSEKSKSGFIFIKLNHNFNLCYKQQKLSVFQCIFFLQFALVFCKNYDVLHSFPIMLIFLFILDSNDLFYLAFPQNYLPKTQMDIYIAGAFFREGEEINYLSNKYLLTRFCGLTWLSH